MLIHQSYKFRIYPTNDQITLINKTIGCCRFVYNHFLAEENASYKNNKKSIGYVGCAKQLTQLKKEDDTIWLKEVDSTALQSSLRNLDTARQNFFQKRAKFPKFKSKKHPVQTYTTKNNHGSIAVHGNRLQVPKLGLVKFAKSREVEGRILSATLRRASSGKYFVAILCEKETTPLSLTGSGIGLDLGLTDLATTQNDEKILRQRFTQKAEQRLAKAQRVLARRVKGSSNWYKQKRVVARIHEQIANQRLDSLHKETTKLVKNHDLFCLETLGIKDLLAEKFEDETNKHKAQRTKNIADASWGKFVALLSYKCQ
ncbi:MAG: RNA-guided endonuclease TnpB family protein [Enterococcus sp.]